MDLQGERVRVAIVGSRDFSDPALVERVVADLPADTVVVSGGARGVDSWAVAAAQRRGLQTEVIRPEGEKYGRSAGFKRNVLIIERAERVIAFWDGKSNGTRHSIDLAKKACKPVDLIIVNPGGVL